MTERPKGDAGVLKGYFGFLPGQKLADFADELKSLSADEKAQLAAGIRDETYTY